MTYTTISGASVKSFGSNDGKMWVVTHPSNGCNLAYCDTQDEAMAVVSFFNALDQLLARVQK